MAVRGYLRIAETNRTFTVVADRNDTTSLPGDEAALAHRLFSADPTMVLKPYTQRWRIPPSMNEWRAVLRRTYRKRYFPTNSRVTAVGLMLALLAVALPILAFQPLDSGSIMIGIAFFGFNSFAVLGVVMAFSQYVEMVQRRRARMPYRPDDRTKAIVLTVFAVGCGGLATVFTSLLLPKSISPLYFLPSLAACFAHGAGAYIVKVLSPEGRVLLTRIQGFRQYLAGSYPSERIDSSSGLDVFERYLPYAIALGVSRRWASQFDGVRSTPGYLPAWYTGDAIPVRSPSDLADLLSGSFMEAAGNASQAQISSGPS